MFGWTLIRTSEHSALLDRNAALSESLAQWKADGHAAQRKIDEYVAYIVKGMPALEVMEMTPDEARRVLEDTEADKAFRDYARRLNRLEMG